MKTAHTPMYVIAAKVLCQRGAEMCDVNFDDSWKQYGEDYLRDAQAVLDAVGAPDLLEALKNMRRAYVNLMESGRDRIIFLGGECDPLEVMEAGDPNLRTSAAAIAKATGAAS